MKFEQLQPRLCFASVWQNPSLRLDVDGSDDVSVADTACIFDRLNQASATSASQLPVDRDDGAMFYDTSGDMLVTPLDALLILNALNRYTEPLAVSGGISVPSDPNQNGVVLGDSFQIIGQSLGAVRIDLRPSLVDAAADSEVESAPPIASTISSDDGSFVLQVTLDRGRHDVELVATDPLGRSRSVFQTIRRGDVVEDWNSAVLHVVRNDVLAAPPVVARDLAMIHTAMFDAANSIEPAFESYLGAASLNGIAASDVSSASPEIAAAAAAHYVASALYDDPDQMAIWDATLAESLSQITDETAKDAAIRIGQAVGAAMWQRRSDDGADAESLYTPGDQPGDWNPTEPDFADPLLPQWRYVTPFAIKSAEAFRPEPPPSLDSAEYAAGVDEVMKIGGVDSTVRTTEQDEIAIFWADIPGTFTPPGHWNRIAADVTSTRDLSFVEKTRVFSLMNIALADAAIACWDAKFEYDMWRPIDAIRRADTDGNDSTAADPGWTPAWINPPFPTYTSGHSSFSAAAATVLSRLIGDAVAFTSEGDVFDGEGHRIRRSFDHFSAAADEAGMSRVYGGIHFNFDNTAGLESGRAVGTDVVNEVMRPI